MVNCVKFHRNINVVWLIDALRQLALEKLLFSPYSGYVKEIKERFVSFVNLI